MNYWLTMSLLCVTMTAQKSYAREFKIPSYHDYPRMMLCATTASLYGTAYAWVLYTSDPENYNAQLVETGIHDTAKETYLFSHGMAENHAQADWYTKEKTALPYLMDGRVFTYDYPDATKQFWRVNFTQTSLGQIADTMTLKSAFEQTLALLSPQEQENGIILMGMSRGATTIVNFMGQYKPKHVKAIIVESPFDSTTTLAENIARRLYIDALPGMKTAVHYLMSIIFWQHSRNGARAIDAVTNIDQNIPILFICSEQDALVPKESTIALYKKLKDAGHTKAHIFIAPTGLHGRILHGADGSNYQAVVNAFNKLYGLAHDAALAALGEPLLDAYA